MFSYLYSITINILVMTLNEQLNAQEIHNKIREILMDSNAPEFGDCIIDKICQAANIPDTCAIADEFGELHPQNYYKSINK